MAGAFQNSAFQNSAYQTDKAPPPAGGGGQSFSVGGGGGWKLRKHVEELEYVKQIELRLKDGKTLRAAIDELKKPAVKQEVRQKVARIEKKALRQEPTAIRYLAEQLRSIEAKATIPELVVEDFSQEIEALMLEENEIVGRVVKLLEKRH